MSTFSTIEPLYSISFDIFCRIYFIASVKRTMVMFNFLKLEEYVFIIIYAYTRIWPRISFLIMQFLMSANNNNNPKLINFISVGGCLESLFSKSRTRNCGRICHAV